MWMDYVNSQDDSWYPSYEDCLVAAGAEVHCFQEFGSYQGDWWARVTVDGITGWVKGYYGSCSGCDSLQALLDDVDSKKEWGLRTPG